MNNNVKETLENEVVKKESNKLELSIKILFIILLLLVLLSFLVLLLRITNILPNHTDIFFIEPKKPNTEIVDNEQIWGNNTKINIFRTKEINEDGQIVVESSNGEKIIAPGMEGDYSFEIRNIGNMAVDAKTILSVEIVTNLEEIDELPIEVRFMNYKGEDLFEGGWININDYQECLSELTLGKKSYVDYKFFWRWAYESGNDAFDTLLGNLATGQELSVAVNIVSSATLSDDVGASGGIKISSDSLRTGGNIVPLPYIILNLIILIIIIILIVLHKKKREQESNKIKEAINKNNK